MDGFYALFLGAFAGLTGLLPFLHSNVVLPVAAVLSSGPGFAVFIASFAASRLAFEAVAAVFFAIPGDSQGIAVQPAHGLAREGRGGRALFVMLSSAGIAIVLSVLLVPVHFAVFPILVTNAAPFTWILLALAVLAFFKGGFSLPGAVAFVFSGLFGFLALNALQDPLLPLLAGLFGVPALLLAAEPAATSGQVDVSGDWPGLFFVLVGVLLGFLSGALPAVTPAFIAAVGLLVLSTAPESFLALNSALLSSKVLFDFCAAFDAGKSRSAAAALASANASGGVGFMLLLSAAFFASFFAAAAVVLFFSRHLARLSSLLSTKLFKAALLTVFAFGLLFVGGPVALFVAAVAACIGLSVQLAGLRPALCSGALIVPTLIFYLGLSVPALLLLFRGN